MDRAQRCLARHEYEFPLLFNAYIRSALDKVARHPRRDRGNAPHTARHNDHPLCTERAAGNRGSDVRFVMVDNPRRGDTDQRRQFKVIEVYFDLKFLRQGSRPRCRDRQMDLYILMLREDLKQSNTVDPRTCTCYPNN